jgi:hypothetical protein
MSKVLLTHPRPGEWWSRTGRVGGAARPGRLASGVRPLRFEEALLEAMLDGWARQQQSRMLCRETIVNRRRLVCRLRAHAGAWPWEWCAEHL